MIEQRTLQTGDIVRKQLLLLNLGLRAYLNLLLKSDFLSEKFLFEEAKFL